MKKSKLAKIALSGCLMSSLLLSTNVANAESYNPSTNVDTEAQVTDSINIEEVSEQELEELLVSIEKIPDDVLAQGDEATNEWLSNDLGLNSSGEVTTFGVVGCTSAIGLAIASNAFAASKIAKVKEVIKAAGGARTFATKLNSSYKKLRSDGVSRSSAANQAVREAGSAAGPQALSAAVGFFSVGQVYSACFE